ncbi:MAG: 2-amino-4-hydroxy-6-hydroxymethyldihydropteridine diphosphokinase [Kiritimatiellae bacterium]|nr:2-amino-4-hydroxy-6-hydroxymethyldihydropteridine diphosphokinase [Kiritimatiellia bacterium]
MTRAAVSLGSNMGDRAANLARALAALADFPATRLVAASSVVETEPVGVPEEFAHMKFLNQAALLDTDLSPEEFSRRMHAVEDAMGRVRTVRNGPRVIDIDLIDFGGIVRDAPDLTLPHPRAAERDFVTRPLSEIGFRLVPDRQIEGGAC